MGLIARCHLPHFKRIQTPTTLPIYLAISYLKCGSITGQHEITQANLASTSVESFRCSAEYLGSSMGR